MKTYNKRILLSVTGMSPAVVTETLYALVTEKNFIPTEIQVITTIQGKNKLLSALLGIEGGRKERKGALAEFIEDYGSQYGFSAIHFDESCIHIIEDTSGEKLPDIRTPQENEFAADNIVKLVGSLCQGEESQLHVSIAGGRKTMGFFMGYALSLYGRKQDSLSHVLVDEQFETLPNFYYRKPYSHIIINRDGVELDASKANVMLAEIPWVRLGLGVPEGLKHQAISYSESVKNAQALLSQQSITFLAPLEDRLVKFGSKVIKLAPRGYALLLGLVVAKDAGWQFGIREEKHTIDTYLKIYSQIKEDEEMQKRLAGMDNDLKDVLSESRTDIRKKITENFSLGKGAESDYIPSSSRKTGNYELNIDLDNIDISAIQNELARLKIL
ncbi:CRISPR-associated ring nuclease Csm6 [[Mannheimia] succiniciproducens]|uniref:CRISPR system ring nuclease SSO2081-like domain-containing protein n=1 Tax=Mannheimia succiniciproducens (strain KCTC 0769BP / MBEL55E) TaxID=221988 RepID=Q65S15_MANSM|nr:CRISPR-associated ring nuclease Csm6 [[Mannheimia] succiniciproducens]AAU38245.1 unknown [[Mannheimia] succiniciproducens MBEL55E]